MHKITWQVKLLYFLFLLFTGWWIFVNFFTKPESFDRYIFGALYGLVALWGGVNGLIISKKWGGWSSVMGQGIILLSAGLLFQEVGQIVFSYYNIVAHVQVPYPSLADVGFFGSILFYILGITMLGRASGIKYSLKKISGKLQAILIPLVILIFSYWFFLSKYQFDFTKPLVILLDFGYPLGQAFYVSVAVITYLLSNKVLGGVMKNKIVFIIVAFAAQYLADYNFLFQSSRGTWLNGGYGDYLYLVAYFIMSLGIFRLADVLAEIRRKS